MVCLVCAAVIVGGITLALKLLVRRNRQGECLGIVSTIKWWLAWFYFRRIQKQAHRPFDSQRDLNTKDVKKLGIVANDEQWMRECPRNLLPDVHAYDAVEFNGIDHKGRALVVRLARHQGRCSSASVYLRLQDGVEYETNVHPDCCFYNVDPSDFQAGGLYIKVVEPLRLWRIIFRGVLRQRSKENKSTTNIAEQVDVAFTFLWSPAYHQYVQSHDFDTKMVSDSIATVPWNKQFLHSLNIDPDERFEQWGRMRGQIEIGDGVVTEVQFWAPKIRTFGVDDQEHQNKINIYAHCENGTVISIRSTVLSAGFKNVTFGYLVLASNFGVDTLSDCDLDVTSYFSDNRSDYLTIRFTARGKPYVLSLRLDRNGGFRTLRGDNWTSESTTVLASGYLNNITTHGTVEIVRPNQSERATPHRSSLPLLNENGVVPLDENVMLAISLEHPGCKCSQLVGGKGASLALMMTARSSNAQFDVPKGFCLTKNAFDKHIVENDEIMDAIDRLEDVAWSRLHGNLQDECQHATEAIENSTLSKELKKEILKHLHTSLGYDYGNNKFAIRSSAIGEDGDEMSAAGQNETILGAVGSEKIFEAVTKCWASQFSFRSVEYKRQNGQIINNGMGVVIQEMVNSDVAGVVFTSHPVTGNVSYVVITANYGLGESVVSGISEPDTIVLRNLYDGCQLTIHEKEIGEKKTRVDLAENGGIIEYHTIEQDAKQFALSDKLAISLGETAVFLGQSYGNPRDIEYAIKDDQIYLLQCRPITTHLKETSYEVAHEFDTALITDHEYFTTANVGEVLPGATSPISLTFPMRMVYAASQIENYDKLERANYNPILSQGTITYCNHLIVDKTYQKLFGLSKEISPMSLGVELGIHGRVIADQDLHQAALQRYPLPGALIGVRTLLNIIIKCLIQGKRYLEEARLRYENFTISLDGLARAEELLTRIEHATFEVAEALLVHIKVSTASILWNAIIIGMLQGKSGVYEPDQYNDFATLIGNANGAVSGDVPTRLKELSSSIVKEISAEAFCEMSAESALQWLETEAKAAGNKFREFLKHHGHRGYKEYDISSLTWGMQPTKLVKVLQNTLSVPSSSLEPKKEESLDELLSKLKSPLTSMQRRILKYILPICRNAICYREQSKSQFIHVHHEIRLACRHLGHMMVTEELIPDPELIFFMTHAEIRGLFKARSARTINRAVQRRKIHPKLESLHFPEFIRGDPKAIEEDVANNLDEEATKSGTKLNGYPVCQGVVKGPARVVLTYDEVDQILPGDILITYMTDIGWSPYFTMLAGVVTEIGGLVSHGAVVAREYGLPCIVGAHGATKMFKSGDTVLLNASKGTLELVSE